MAAPENSERSGKISEYLCTLTGKGYIICLCKKFCKIPNRLGGVISQQNLCIRNHPWKPIPRTASASKLLAVKKIGLNFPEFWIRNPDMDHIFFWIFWILTLYRSFVVKYFFEMYSSFDFIRTRPKMHSGIYHFVHIA